MSILNNVLFWVVAIGGFVCLVFGIVTNTKTTIIVFVSVGVVLGLIIGIARTIAGV